MDERARVQSQIQSLIEPIIEAIDGAEGDTVPGAPAQSEAAAPVVLTDDDRFIALQEHVVEARAFLQHRAWDNLAHIERFARAASLALELLPRFTDKTSRRTIAHLLHSLLPTASRARAFVPFADAVSARAPRYALAPGDIPAIHAVYTAFLTREDLLARLVRPGAGPFLVPKSASPYLARGSCTTLVVDDVAADVRGHIVVSKEKFQVRTGPDGKPLLGVDGRAQPITVPFDTLTSWIFSAGPDARGLDLRSDDDRALLLAFAHALRGADVRGRSAFSWLEDGSAPLDVRVEVVTAAVRAAIQVIASHTLDPFASRISLRADDGDGDWQKRAAGALDEVGAFRDVLPRVPVEGARDIVWADAFVSTGAVAGRLSAVAAGRAFARLATSMLAPLGVLPLSGLKDGSGAVLLQRLIPDDDDGALHHEIRLVSFGDVSFGEGVVDAPLADAWHDGRGLFLPEPKGAPRHDVAAMAAWLAFFLEGLAEPPDEPDQLMSDGQERR